MYKKKGYDAFLFIYALICDKRLIPCFSRCDVLATVRLTPKTLHTTVSHQIIIANYILLFAVCSRRLRLISPIRRNVAGRLCGRPTIVFLIFQIKKYGLGLSFRDKVMRIYDIANAGRSGWHTLRRKA